MAEIHNRMPVILADETAKRWVSAGPIAAEELAEFMVPFPAAKMEARPISVLVNNPRYDSAEVLAEAAV
jgi:putative SOS response-associated peptidase YedK